MRAGEEQFSVCSWGKKIVIIFRILVAAGIVFCLAPSLPARAQVSEQAMQSISTPDKVDTRIGPLEFKDGAPSPDTAEKVYDTLDFVRGMDAFLNSYGGASAYAIRQGFLSIGANDNSV